MMAVIARREKINQDVPRLPFKRNSKRDGHTWRTLYLLTFLKSDDIFLYNQYKIIKPGIY